MTNEIISKPLQTKLNKAKFHNCKTGNRTLGGCLDRLVRVDGYVCVLTPEQNP